MSRFEISRRSLIKTGMAGLAASALPMRFSNAASPVTVGIVYVGPRDDFGWNQAHAVAAKALKAVSVVTVVEEENVPETDAVAKSMESMINLDGANLILATSFGYYNPSSWTWRRNIPRWNSVTRRRSGARTRTQECRLLLPLSQPGALRERRRRRPFLAHWQDRLRGRKAHPVRSFQHQFRSARCPLGQSGRHRARDLHG